MYKIMTTPHERLLGIKKLYAVGYGSPVIICIIGLTIFWYTENIFLDLLFDENNNYL
jgi:hypothetical protein